MSVKRRYSSVGPAITHRRILVSDFDAVKVLETEVLHVSGAPERRLELWYMFQFKVHEVRHHFPCFSAHVLVSTFERCCASSISTFFFLVPLRFCQQRRSLSLSPHHTLTIISLLSLSPSLSLPLSLSLSVDIILFPNKVCTHRPT